MSNWALIFAPAVLSAIGPFAGAAEVDRAAHADRGAAVPWVTYEAEAAKTSGIVAGPDYTGQTPAREASGRQHVQLKSQGDFLEFTAKQDAQGVVVRYSIPDAADCLDATLSLSINGQPATKLALTAKHSHLYGPYPFTNEPAAGSPRNFWDETRLMPGTIHAGDVIRIEKRADDRASEYLIDFVDLETVPAPLLKPADAISIADFGATPDDATDDRPALLAAIAAAKSQHKSVWLPAGRFVMDGAIDLSDVTVQGAGMWYTTLVGTDDYAIDHRVVLNGAGSNITLADFAITGKLNYRSDSEPNDGIGGSFGTGSSIRNLWIEHTKAGAWLTNADGLIVDGCRFRNTLADGMNLCLGMRNTVVRNCTARGTGDDCFAMWPATYAPAKQAHGANRYEHCTAQMPFLAQGFAIYGGDGNSVIDCEAIDIPYGAGLFASTTFPTDVGFRGTTLYQRNRIVRAGDREGAVGTVANKVDLVGLRFEDLDVIDSPHDAIRFMSVHGGALRDTTLDRIRIVNTGVGGAGYGVVSADDAIGAVTLNHVAVEEAKSGAFRNVSPAFKVIEGEGTSALHEGERAKVGSRSQAK